MKRFGTIVGTIVALMAMVVLLTWAAYWAFGVWVSALVCVVVVVAIGWNIYELRHAAEDMTGTCNPEDD